MSRKIIKILWFVNLDHWEYQKEYEDGTLSEAIPTEINIFTPDDSQDLKKMEVAWYLIGTREGIPVDISRPSLFSAEAPSSNRKGEFVRYLLRRLDGLCRGIKECGLVPERRTALSKAVFSVYVDLIDLGAKVWADQILKKHGVDHTKESVISSA